MSETVELRLYSPLQVDIIDRDALGRAIPFQAVSNDCRSEYARIIMNAFRAIQPQEDARNAFIAPEQDWSEICEKISQPLKVPTGLYRKDVPFSS